MCILSIIIPIYIIPYRDIIYHGNLYDSLHFNRFYYQHYYYYHLLNYDDHLTNSMSELDIKDDGLDDNNNYAHGNSGVADDNIKQNAAVAGSIPLNRYEHFNNLYTNWTTRKNTEFKLLPDKAPHSAQHKQCHEEELVYLKNLSYKYLIKLSRKQLFVACAAYTGKLNISNATKGDMTKHLMKNELFIKYGEDNPPASVINEIDNAILHRMNNNSNDNDSEDDPCINVSNSDSNNSNNQQQQPQYDRNQPFISSTSISSIPVDPLNISSSSNTSSSSNISSSSSCNSARSIPSSPIKPQPTQPKRFQKTPTYDRKGNLAEMWYAQGCES